MPFRTLPEHVSDAMDTVQENTGVNVPKTTAGITLEAYWQATLAAATALPLTLGVVGPIPTISQAQGSIKRPEEHLPSQNQEANTILGYDFRLSATSTSSDEFAIVKDGNTVYYRMGRKPPCIP
jgi:hypothetical protein